MSALKSPRLFDDPAQNRKRRILMQVTDAGTDSVQVECRKCGHKEWLRASRYSDEGAVTHPEARRGIPCPNCNKATTP